MGLGILDDHALEHVPGTALVLESKQRREIERDVARTRGLKYDETGTVLLVPQPSDDPNDPLVGLLIDIPALKLKSWNLPERSREMRCQEEYGTGLMYGRIGLSAAATPSSSFSPSSPS
jgi:hypothetical protein